MNKFPNQTKNLHNPHFMTFSQFLASGGHLRMKNKYKATSSKRKTLKETLGNFENEISETMFAAIPTDAIDRDRLINLLGIKLRKIAESLDIVVTVIGLQPAKDEE